MESKQFIKSFDKDSIVFKQGDEGDSAYIIEKGSVEITVIHENKKFVLATLGEGELFGEMALVDNQVRTASVKTLESTELVVIPSDFIHQKIEMSDPTVRFFLQVIMERYRDMHTRLLNVVEGVTPKDNGEFYASTTNVVKNLMTQFLDMQTRIMEAMNTSSDVKPLNTNDVKQTRSVLTMEHKIQQGIENEEFELFYQPIKNLQTGDVDGCEALIRWNRPGIGYVSPGEFIHVAETSGQIIDLGFWIIEQGLKDCKELSSCVDRPFFTSINLSGKQFEHPTLVKDVGDLLSLSNVQPEKIKFEITESILMSDPQLASDILHGLKDTGAKLAIDDFGTGYSSFSYLHRFPFDTLKIDIAFISTMLQNKKSYEIVQSLIGLAHNLKMNVVSEGIETQYEEKALVEINSDYGQGYYFSKPVPLADMRKLLG